MIVLKRFFFERNFFCGTSSDRWVDELAHPKDLSIRSSSITPLFTSSHTHTHSLSLSFHIDTHSLFPHIHFPHLHSSLTNIHTLSLFPHRHTPSLSLRNTHTLLTHTHTHSLHTHTHTHFSPHHILIFVRTFNGIIGPKCKARIFITPAICFHHGPTGKNSRLIKITVPTSKI